MVRNSDQGGLTVGPVQGPGIGFLQGKAMPQGRVIRVRGLALDQGIDSHQNATIVIDLAILNLIALGGRKIRLRRDLVGQSHWSSQNGLMLNSRYRK